MLLGIVAVVASVVAGFGTLLFYRPEKALVGLAILACFGLSYAMLTVGDVDDIRPGLAVGMGGSFIVFVGWFVSIFLDGDAIMGGTVLILFLLLLALGRGKDARH